MRSTLQIVAGAVVLAICGVVAWLLLSASAQYLLGLDKTIAPAAIAALVTVFTVLFAFWKDRAKSRSEVHREKKIEVYSIFFDIVFSTLKRTKSGEDVSSYFESLEFRDKFIDLMKGVTFYGSPNVVRTLSEWRINPSSTSDGLHAIRMVGSVLLAMRKDIGLSNFGLDNLSIHQVYVNDDLRDFEKIKASK